MKFSTELKLLTLAFKEGAGIIKPNEELALHKIRISYGKGSRLEEIDNRAFFIGSYAVGKIQ